MQVFFVEGIEGQCHSVLAVFLVDSAPESTSHHPAKISLSAVQRITPSASEAIQKASPSVLDPESSKLSS